MKQYILPITFLIIILTAFGCATFKTEQQKYEEYMNATEQCVQDNVNNYNTTQEILRHACTKYVTRENKTLFEQVIKDLS